MMYTLHLTFHISLFTKNCTKSSLFPASPVSGPCPERVADPISQFKGQNSVKELRVLFPQEPTGNQTLLADI